MYRYIDITREQLTDRQFFTRLALVLVPLLAVVGVAAMQVAG